MGEINPRITGKRERVVKMDEMNQAEVAREETEQKMLYKFLLMIKESKDLKELEEKVKAQITK